jgi:hypothetical protein
MSNSMRSVFAAVGFLGWCTTSALGQAVGDQRFDATSGDYFVWVMNDDLQLVEMRIVPPNKVSASVTLRIDSGELRPFRYVYTVNINPGTQQPLKFMEIDCPASSDMERLTATAVQNGLTTIWDAEQIRSNVRPRCDIDYQGDGLEVGGRLQAGVETILLPAVGEIRLFGDTPGFTWPTFDPIEENEPARRVANELSGFTGGWKSFLAPVPTRDPNTVVSAGAGISILQNDLERACGSLGWITTASVCYNLTAKLQQASQAVIQGDNSGARTQLQAFLTELQAQHDGAGSPVNDSAFWLLKVNAEYVLSLLPGPVTPSLNWAIPSPIVFGTALSATQLNATALAAGGAEIPGSFSYAPASGTILSPGTQALSVVFTPTDGSGYTTATKSVSVDVRYTTTAGHRFLQPINTPPQDRSVFHLGSTIPVKFDLFRADGLTPVTTAVATLQVNRISNGAPDPVNETIYSTVPDQGTSFHYTGGHYQFNLGTGTLTTGTYRLTALLDDGSKVIEDVELRSN